MAKVRFIGDPSGEEHRRGTHFAGVELPLGRWVGIDDEPARKLLKNPHFEVDGVEPLIAELLVGEPRAAAAVAIAAHGDLARELDLLKAAHEAFAAEHRDLLEAYAARGAELNEARARIAQLEATLANAAPAAQGDGDGGDADGSGKPGAEEDQSARDGANGRRRGSAGR